MWTLPVESARGGKGPSPDRVLSHHDLAVMEYDVRNLDKEAHHDEVQRELSEAAVLVFFLLLVLGTVLVFVILALWQTIQSVPPPPQTDIRRSEERLGQVPTAPGSRGVRRCLRVSLALRNFRC